MDGPAALDLSFDALDAPAIPASVSLVIQNVWTGATVPGWILNNLVNARAANRRVGAYCVINPDVADNVSRALIYVSPEFCALDVELYPSMPREKLRSESDRLAAARPAWPRIIYTSRSEWQRMTGDDTSFAHDHYLWDGRPGDNLPYIPYGGWPESRVIGVQRTSTVTLGKMDVDLSDWRFDLMAADPATKALTLDAITRAKAELQRMEDAVNGSVPIEEVLTAADLIQNSAIVEALLRFGQFTG